MRIVVYGLLLEMARRGFQWLYTRILIRMSHNISLCLIYSTYNFPEPKVSATFTQGDPAYEWIMLYLVCRLLHFPLYLPSI
jgi:hypothetical protein